VITEKQVNIQKEEWESGNKKKCFSRLSENHKLNTFVLLNLTHKKTLNKKKSKVKKTF